jgi:hypothetical protein
MTVIRVDKIRKLVFPNKFCQPVLRVDPNFQPLFNGYMRIGALGLDDASLTRKGILYLLSVANLAF